MGWNQGQSGTYSAVLPFLSLADSLQDSHAISNVSKMLSSPVEERETYNIWN